MRRRLAAILTTCVLALSAQGLAQRGAWCAQPIGAAVSQFYSDSAKTILRQLDELPGKSERVLYLAVPTAADRVALRPHLARELSRNSKIAATAAAIARQQGITREAVLRELADKALEDFGDDDRYVYVNSNVSDFAGIARIDGVESRGASMQLDRAGFDAMLDSTSGFGQNVRSQLKDLNATLIVVDGFDVDPAVVKQLGAANSIALRVNRARRPEQRFVRSRVRRPMSRASAPA